MADNDSGGRKLPPPHRGYKQVTPPPTPMARARANTPSPISSTQASSGPKPAPERPVLVRVPAPSSNLPHAFILRVCKTLDMITRMDPAMGQFTIDGDAIFLTRDGSRSQVAKASEKGEVRIFLEDLGLCHEIDEVVLPGTKKEQTVRARVVSEQVIRQFLGECILPNSIISILTHSRQVYLRIVGNNVFLAAASSRESSRPLIEVGLALD